MEKLYVKYESDVCQDFVKVQGKSDWIDLKIAKDYDIKKGEFVILTLGFAMKLPKGFEAHVVPRSSTFKNTGLLQVNSMGIIDNSYSGDVDF